MIIESFKKITHRVLYMYPQTLYQIRKKKFFFFHTKNKQNEKKKSSVMLVPLFFPAFLRVVYKPGCATISHKRKEEEEDT